MTQNILIGTLLYKLQILKPKVRISLTRVKPGQEANQLNRSENYTYKTIHCPNAILA